MFRIWGDDTFAEKVKNLVEGKADAVAAPQPSVIAKAPEKPAPKRSEAITLLSVLQREARFVDFVQEPITGYSDAQIGAAVRTVHDDCARVLDRIFALKPLRAEADGAQVDVPADFDSAQIRVVGNVPGAGALRGTLCHPGWTAAKCELPEWTGRDESALVVAACEVEVK